MPSPITLGRVLPLNPGLESVATDVLQGLQYSFVAAAAHPEVRLPFGSLEEAFQDAVALRPTEQRWTYHSRARRMAMASAAARHETFGRYGLFGAEEFACGGLLIAYRHLAAERPDRRRLRLVGRGISPQPEPEPHESADVSRRTLALYITEVCCVDRNAQTHSAEEIALGGLALDPAGGLAKVARFLVRDDFDDGVRKDYGVPGRKFCEFPVPSNLGDRPLTYGAAAFLEVADRAGFYEALAGAWSKASPILHHAVESRIAGAEPAMISRAAGWVIDRFVRWLGEEFQDELFPPGLAFAGVQAGLTGDGVGLGEQLTFVGRRGRYRVRGQWRMSCA